MSLQADSKMDWTFYVGGWRVRGRATVRRAHAAPRTGLLRRPAAARMRPLAAASAGSTEQENFAHPKRMYRPTAMQTWLQLSHTNQLHGVALLGQPQARHLYMRSI